MKKRLRKKKSIYEFFEPFFEVSGEYSDNFLESELDELLDSLCELVDSLDMEFWGNFSGGCFSTNSSKKPITKEKLQQIFDFFEKVYEKGIITKFHFDDTIDTYQKYLKWKKEFYK